MTKRDFQLIADAVADMNRLSDAERDYVAMVLADTLASTNVRFDRSKFLAACGACGIS